MDIEELLYNESLVCDAHIYKNEPFKFVERILKNYDLCKEYEFYHCCDVALDIYNWYIKNEVYHDAKRMALMKIATFIIKEDMAEAYRD